MEGGSPFLTGMDWRAFCTSLPLESGRGFHSSKYCEAGHQESTLA